MSTPNLSAECPCGRARAGCTYHDPALQPQTPPGATYAVGDVQVSVGGVALVPAAPHHSGKIYRVTRIPGTNIPGIGIDVGGVVLRDCDYELEVFPPTGAGGVRMYNLMINVTAPTDTELKLHAMFAAMTPPVVHGRQCIAVTINSMLSSVQTWWTLRTTRPGVHTYHLRGVMP